MSSGGFDLTGKTAVVTGGNRGLGRGIAESLLRAGADLVLLQRQRPPAELEATAHSLGRELWFHKVELADPSSIAFAAKAVLDDHRIDILINNAGMQFRAPAEQFPLERFDELMSVNVRAAFELCQLFGSPMLDRREGKIVNLASLLSFQGGVTVPAYAASKGAIMQLTKALCNEWAGRNVNVNAIAPGYMETDLNGPLLADPVRSKQILDRIPAARWGAAEDVGDAAVFLCSAAADYIHGVVLPIDGGWLAR